MTTEKKTTKTTKKTPAKKAPTKEPTVPTCKCGCGQEIGPNATYKPGHDAKHVSILIADCIHQIEFEGNSGNMTKMVDTIIEYRDRLPSIPLRNKFINAIHRQADLEHLKFSASFDSNTENEYTSPWFRLHPDDLSGAISARNKG